MIISELFNKPIDRDIKGVIKVGQSDEGNVRQELEEYVVTRELQKHFRDFFSSYKRGINSTTDKMGVWISGFFGSGKSHFLKILSYLLENKVVDGKTALQYFEAGAVVQRSFVFVVFFLSFLEFFKHFQIFLQFAPSAPFPRYAL